MNTSDHLTAEQPDHLQEEILAEIVLLTTRMKSSADTVQPVELDPGAVGRLSRMDELQNQAMAKGLREREQQRLVELQRALERIKAATYGICASCGGRIPYTRLEVFPETPTCMPCSH
jgi:DnaK suppressor protein